MKIIASIISLLIAGTCFGQKVRTIKRIDTMLVYKNASVIVYKNRFGRTVRDTLWNGQGIVLNVDNVDEMIIDSDVELKRRKN